MSDTNSSTSSVGCCGFGNVAALCLSYYLNHSVGWALLHCVFGYFYIIYAVLTGQVFK